MFMGIVKIIIISRIKITCVKENSNPEMANITSAIDISKYCGKSHSM